MPRILDNLKPGSTLLRALEETLDIAHRADFCVGYFNLRGWKHVDGHVERWIGGEGAQARVLVGMQPVPDRQLRELLRLHPNPGVDNREALRLKQRLTREFRDQLLAGRPTNEDEAALRRLASQLRAGKMVVKLFLRHPLHAKLYLCFREDPNTPIVGYLGSSNLTFAGLVHQGELNIDVLDRDATQKLSQWFDDRWNDRLCVDVSDELVRIIDESWARPDPVSPYLVYLKMAYHLSNEARAGLAEFRIPSDFGNRLFDFQTAAVKIASRHLNKRGGVLIGDVVGLGKTLMATAVARIFEDDHGARTLIICPKGLVRMWEGYVHRYRLRAKVLSISKVPPALGDLRRYQLVVIDESHNLRNRDGKRYRAIQEYIRSNESKCILLSATPYNKTYRDLGNQLRLFVDEEADLGIRPERLLKAMGEVEFAAKHQTPPRTLGAFEFSEYPDDWREVMRLFLVRRTRSFIQANYAETDPETGRKCLTYEDGGKSFFPERVPKTIRFAINESDPHDQYAQLYSTGVVGVIGALQLPRYGLGKYALKSPAETPSSAEDKRLKDLSRAGKRLIGFCRTNLFKRLESSGAAFIQSVERHLVRNYVFLHALRKGLPLPIGPQDAELLDAPLTDEDSDALLPRPARADGEDPASRVPSLFTGENVFTEAEFQRRAARAYAAFQSQFEKRFAWLRASLFSDELAEDLESDAEALLGLLRSYGQWDPARDEKLDALHCLLNETYAGRKVLVFSQFADTVRYLERELRNRGVDGLEGVTGDSNDPTWAAYRFSPESNGCREQVPPSAELRILIATDLLSEGQNLQDCAAVVNYDLPWAIIRLIQRAGRVDRIGQTAEEIACCSFLPAEGIERIIELRKRVRTRLRENAEVVGADEVFFEDEAGPETILDLYHEKAGILDGDSDSEVDLASHAYQIWKNAITADASLEKQVVGLPDVVFATRRHDATPTRPDGVLVFLRTAEGNDALAYMDRQGRSITESQLQVLAAAECGPDTPALLRHETHHDLVAAGVRHLAKEETRTGGQLGRPSGARYRTYTRLKKYEDKAKGTLFWTADLARALDEIYRFPLRQSAADALNRQLRSGMDDPDLAALVIRLRDEDRLCLTAEEHGTHREPQIICSMGLSAHDADA